jgi:hypothetical protein
MNRAERREWRMVAFDDEAGIACDFVIAQVRVHDRIIVRIPIITLARSNGSTPSVSECYDVYELLKYSVVYFRHRARQAPN